MKMRLSKEHKGSAPSLLDIQKFFSMDKST